jgi:putative transposase
MVWIFITRRQPGNPQQNAYIERYKRTVKYNWLSQYFSGVLITFRSTSLADYELTTKKRPTMGIGGKTPKQKLALAA